MASITNAGLRRCVVRAAKTVSRESRQRVVTRSKVPFGVLRYHCQTRTRTQRSPTHLCFSYLDKIEEGMFDDEEDEIIPRGDDEDEDDAAMMEAVLNDEEEDSNEDLEEEEIEEGADEDFEEEEIEEGTDAQPVFAQTEAEEELMQTGCPDGFKLNFLWLDRHIAMAVDQVFSKDARSPLTEYFVWPRTNAWEELQECLNQNSWIEEVDRILLLNRATEVINYWQDEEAKHTMEDARKEFPDCVFTGS